MILGPPELSCRSTAWGLRPSAFRPKTLAIAIGRANLLAPHLLRYETDRVEGEVVTSNSNAGRMTEQSSPNEQPVRGALARARAVVQRRLFGDSNRPMKIGRYLVLDTLGRGAMGEVLSGYDPVLGREVAIKLVSPRSEPDAETLGARLGREARAMAKLSHPNVCQVYEVLEHDDRPAIVMEYIAGRTLDRWVQQTPRSVDDIRSMFASLAAGLAAAHRVGLVHRDFKPANVLVTTDGDHAKIVDFGLAKSVLQIEPSMLTPDPISGTGADGLSTETGTVMGTPAYMAPEQHRGVACDTRADQFAFCVTLYEALYGPRPFHGGSIREIASAKFEPLQAPQRRSSIPRWLFDVVRRGLAVNPEDRWPSMDALSSALASDPRERRRRVAGWGAAATLVGAGVAGAMWPVDTRCSGAADHLAGVWDEPRRRQVEDALFGLGRSYATDVWHRTREHLDAYRSDWILAHTRACESTAMGGRSEALLDLEMACLRRAKQDLRATVDTLSDADLEMLENVHVLTAGLPPLARCRDLEILQDDAESPLAHEVDTVREIRAEVADARARNDAGRYDQALDAVERARRLAATIEYEPVEIEIALQQGYALARIGKHTAAEAANNEALRLAAMGGRREAMREALRQLMFSSGVLTRHFEEALQYARLVRGLTGDDAHEQAMLATDLGAVFHTRGKFEEAEAQERRALALWDRSSHSTLRDIAVSHRNLGRSLHAQGRFDDALVHLRSALELWIRALGPRHPLIAVVRTDLAQTLRGVDRDATAESELRTALSIQEESLDPQNPDLARTRDSLGRTLHSLGHHDAAEAQLLLALDVRTQVWGTSHLDVADTHQALAYVNDSRGRVDRALWHSRQALEVAARALSAYHPDLAGFHSGLASFLFHLEDYAGAEKHERAALRIQQRTLRRDHVSLAQTRYALAATLMKLDRPELALPLAEQSWERWQRDDIALRNRARVAFVLAQALWQVDPPLRDRARARRLAEQASRAAREAGDAHAALAAQIRQWLEIRPRHAQR
jgi:tetratricopeptide (TPR) repeat protein